MRNARTLIMGLLVVVTSLFVTTGCLYSRSTIERELFLRVKEQEGQELAQDLLLHFLNNVEVLDLPHKETIQAIAMAERDMEDSIQLKISLFHELDYLITNDVKFMKDSSPILPILSLEVFLSKFNQS